MAKPPATRRIDAFYLEPLSDWTRTMVKGALTQHEAGRFRSSARLVDAMGRNAEISKALGTRVRALKSRTALPFCIEPSDRGDGRQRNAATKRMGELWWDVVTETWIEQTLRDAAMIGVSIGQLTWLKSNGEWIPRINWLPPHGLALERCSLTGERRLTWVYTSDDGTREEVTPGDGRWFLYLPNGPRSWMHGAVRAIGLPWHTADNTDTDWDRYNEKHGLPILEIDEPHWAHDDVEGDEGADGNQADAYYAQFKNIPSEGVLRQPQGPTLDAGGWKARWLEPKSESYVSFEKHLDRYAQRVSGLILGDDPSDPKGGDGELQSERIRHEHLSSDAETLTSALREQVWKPWAEYNYGDPELAGWGRWTTTDLVRRTMMLKTGGEAMTILAPLGVDIEPIGTEIGVKFKAGGPVMPAPAAPAPTEQPQET